MKYVFVFLAVLACATGYVTLVTHLNDRRADRDQFAYVCAWEGGEVQGEACIKLGKVILTKQEVMKKLGDVTP